MDGGGEEAEGDCPLLMLLLLFMKSLNKSSRAIFQSAKSVGESQSMNAHLIGFEADLRLEVVVDNVDEESF